VKVLEQTKKQKDEEKAKKKEKERLLKEQRDHELQKKMIIDYKQKKLITEELLANADLDGISGGDDYQQHQFDDSGNESNEDDANAVMD